MRRKADMFGGGFDDEEDEEMEEEMSGIKEELAEIDNSLTWGVASLFVMAILFLFFVIACILYCSENDKGRSLDYKDIVLIVQYDGNGKVIGYWYVVGESVTHWKNSETIRFKDSKDKYIWISGTYVISQDIGQEVVDKLILQHSKEDSK